MYATTLILYMGIPVTTIRAILEVGLGQARTSPAHSGSGGRLSPNGLRHIHMLMASWHLSLREKSAKRNNLLMYIRLHTNLIRRRAE